MTDFIPASSSQLNDAIIQVERSGHPGHATLLRAVRDRQISLAVLPRNAPITDDALNRSSRPKLVLLGDDDDHSPGPAGFRSWQRLKTWAGCGLIHAAAADVETYQIAIAMADANHCQSRISRTARPWLVPQPASRRAGIRPDRHPSPGISHLRSR